MLLITDLGRLYPKSTSKEKKRYGLYECPICLVHFKAQSRNVKSGLSTKCKSCASRIRMTTHGESHTPPHTKWCNMRQRCYDSNHPDYKWYGARGITVHTPWLTDYEAYRDYILALPNAFQDGLTIDRINNDGNYEPNNLRWATYHEQALNRRKKECHIV